MSMRRIIGILIAVAFVAALPGSVAAARPEPRVTIVVGPSGDLTDLYRSVGADAAREARRWTSDVVTRRLPERHLAGRQASPARRIDRRLPRPRQRLPVALSRQPLPADPERARAEPGRRRWRHGPSVLRRGVPRARDPPGAGCGRPAPPPVLCERQLGAGPARGLVRCRPAAGRQLRRGLAARRCRCGHRRHVRRAASRTSRPARRRARRSTGSGATSRRIPRSRAHVRRAPGARATRSPWIRPGSAPGFNRSIVWTPGLTGTPSSATGPARSPRARSARPCTPTPTVTSLAALGVTFRTPGLAPAGATPSGLVAGTPGHAEPPDQGPEGRHPAGDLEARPALGPRRAGRSATGDIEPRRGPDRRRRHGRRLDSQSEPEPERLPDDAAPRSTRPVAEPVRAARTRRHRAPGHRGGRARGRRLRRHAGPGQAGEGPPPGDARAAGRRRASIGSSRPSTMATASPSTPRPRPSSRR